MNVSYKKICSRCKGDAWHPVEMVGWTIYLLVESLRDKTCSVHCGNHPGPEQERQQPGIQRGASSVADVSETEPSPCDSSLSCGFPACGMNRAGVATSERPCNRQAR